MTKLSSIQSSWIDYRLCASEENKCLPHISWLSKLHKNPTKARFIIAPPKYFLKPFSKSITAVFKILSHEKAETSSRDIVEGSTLFKKFWTIKQASHSCLNFIHWFLNIVHKYSFTYTRTNWFLNCGWCRARDLFGSQIPVTTGGFDLRISCIRGSYLTH